MKWCRDIYVSDSVADKKRKILHNLKHNKLQINVCVITLPVAPGGIMEIYPAYVLLQQIYKKQDICVIGIAADMQEAYGLAEKIVMDCYDKTGTFDIEKFINERQDIRS